MCGVSQRDYARSCVWTMAMLDTGAKRKPDVVCQQEPQRETEEVGISLPAYNVRNRLIVQTAVPKRSDLATNEPTDLSKNAVGDLIVVDIERQGEMMPRIVNIYDQREGDTGQRPARRPNWHRIMRQWGCATVLMEHFNAHSQRWYSRSTERRDPTYWEEIIEEHTLVIGNNDQPTNYWMRQNRMGQSVIDLTLAIRPFRKWMFLDGIHAPGYDHEIIVWELDMEKQEEAGGTHVVGWNLEAMLQ
jgi:hypothetical protein